MRRALDPRLAAVLAVTVVGGVLIGILAFGRLHYPDFPSLLEQPDRSLPGRVAWITWDEPSGSGESCVWVMPASGAEPPRRLRCAPDLSGPLGWVDGRVVVSGQTGVVRVDPDTGETQRSGPEEPGDRPMPEPPPRTWHGITAWPKSPRPGVVELWLEESNLQWRVASVEGPRDYQWWDVAWSPEGRYLAVHDSAERILIVDTKEKVVRLLAEDAGMPAWGP